ncbi:MAG: outer membrane beta-barrel protein, partial [Bradyrhizobium sp.]|nr:outer membrane beta-barrel protein [Bradyrhizobium sp.]
PFVDVAVDRRVHDIAVDAEGFRRDSTGTAVEAGVTFAYADKLTGDVAVGYLTRRYQDPMLKPVSGFIADANLTWQYAKETAIMFGAKSQVVEITEPGISGVLKRDVTVGIEHQFEPWLVGTFLAGYGQDAFTGTTRVDNRYLVELGMLYKFSRLLQLRASVRREETRSNFRENDLSATVVQVGARVQY